MKASIGALALLGLFTTDVVLADGNELLGHCQVAIRSMDTGIGGNYDVGKCFGMIQGVTESILILNGSLPADLKFCIPDGASGVSQGQSVRTVAKFLRDNPALLHEHESLLIMMAYKKAYPCGG